MSDFNHVLDSHHIFRIAGTEEESIVDGPGIRNVIFFQGCLHACKGCHNLNTWALNRGFEVNLFNLIDEWKDNKLIDGITLSGGDPLNFLFYLEEDYPKFQVELHKLHNFITCCYKLYNGNIVLYTGFEAPDLLNTIGKLQHRSDVKCWKDLLIKSRYIITAPFIEEMKSIDCAFRGSTNQRIVSFFYKKESLAFVDISEFFDNKIILEVERILEKNYPYKFNIEM